MHSGGQVGYRAPRAASETLTRERETHNFGPLLRQQHDLFPDPKRPPHAIGSGQPCYLLPAEWMLRKFQPDYEQFVLNRDKPLVERPTPAPMNELLCRHGKLNVNPVPKGMGGELEGIDEGQVTYYDAAAWKGLVDERYVTSVQSVVNDSVVSFGPWHSVIVELNPPPCEVCIKARQTLHHARLHQFKGGSISVRPRAEHRTHWLLDNIRLHKLVSVACFLCFLFLSFQLHCARPDLLTTPVKSQACILWQR